jgi:hypothetical protein
MPRPHKPVSEKQLAANRANATQSTGPRTPEGKAHSAGNARKHGFTAATFAVVRLEDLNEVDHLKADLVAVYQPVNAQELFAVERIALAQQALLRAARLEAGLFTTCLNTVLDSCGQPFIPMSQELVGDGDIEVTRAQNRNYALAEGFERMTRTANTWSLFLRYQAQSERFYRRAVEDLERLQALRPNLPNEPISPPVGRGHARPSVDTPAPHEPVIPPVSAILKQRVAPLRGNPNAPGIHSFPAETSVPASSRRRTRRLGAGGLHQRLPAAESPIRRPTASGACQCRAGDRRICAH